MPCYLGSGSFEYDKERYRFVVMDRYGQDLWSIFLKNKKMFPCSAALQVGLQVVSIFKLFLIIIVEFLIIHNTILGYQLM